MSKYPLLLKSENTNKVYIHSFQLWTKFIKDHEYSEIPTQPVHVALYLIHLIDCRVSYSTVNSNLFDQMDAQFM